MGYCFENKVTVVLIKHEPAKHTRGKHRVTARTLTVNCAALAARVGANSGELEPRLAAGNDDGEGKGEGDIGVGVVAAAAVVVVAVVVDVVVAAAAGVGVGRGTFGSGLRTAPKPPRCTRRTRTNRCKMQRL